MRKKHYTIMIAPGSRARLLRVKLRQDALLALAGVAALCVLSAAALPFIFQRAVARGAEVNALRAENETLRSTNGEIESLRHQVAYFEDKATKFALMAGVEDLPSSRGVGGLREPGEPAIDDGEALLDEEFESLKERSSVLEESFNRLDKVYSDQSLMLATTPSVAPVKGMISYGYAWRNDPFTGNRAFHKGVDIVAPRGTEVIAPADALVLKAGRLPGYGNVVYLSHSNGLTSRYAHLQGFSVRPGQKVSRGEVIGQVGNTGRSLGAHLHYEILVNNRRVDPSQYILDEDTTY